MILSHILLYRRSSILYGIYFLVHSIREKLHHCQTAKTGSALCVISVVRLLKNATEGIDLDTSSLLLPRYKMVALERWTGLGGGGAWRSPEEVFEGGYFFWALLCIKRDSISGIQYFFEGQIINTMGLRNLGQWQQLEGSVNTHRKKTMFSIWKHNTKIGSAEERIRKAVLRLIERESANSIMQEMTQEMDNKKRTWSFCGQTTPWKLPTFSSTRPLWTRRSVLPVIDDSYRKILKISPGAYIFQSPLWGAYFWRGLSTEGKLRFEIDWASLIVGSKFTGFALFYFVIWGQFSKYKPPGGLYLEGRFNGGFFALPVWRAYTRRGLFSESYGITTK